MDPLLNSLTLGTSQESLPAGQLVLLALLTPKLTHTHSPQAANPTLAVLLS